MELKIGAIVQCRDGVAGRLKYVVIDPDDSMVTYLIVERGALLRRDIVVPAAWVVRADAETIVINASAADLKELPEYREIDFAQPDPSYRPLSGHRVEEVRIWVHPYGSIDAGRPWVMRHVRLGINDEDVVLRRGFPVQTRDGRYAGALDHLVADPTGLRVSHLVVRKGWLWNRHARIVPIEQVDAVLDYGIWLKLSAEELEQLPPYQAPASDQQLTAMLQRSLETDPQTRDAGLRAEVHGGVVNFIGAAAADVVEAARKLARRLRGVIGFADELQEAPELPAPPLRIGAPVFATDGRYGTLDKVIVDPHARRVTHLVVRKGWLLTEDRIIPITLVERALPDGIHLKASSVELEQLPAYREELFVEPLEGWEPLAPYSLHDTLFWGGPYIGVATPILPAVEHVIPVGVPEGELVLRRGADVFANDALVGALDHVLVDPQSGTMTHLVVEEHGTGRRVIVPAEWVQELQEGAIVLSRWNPYAPGVPTYIATRDDAAIAADLADRLQASQALSRVQAQLEGGVAQLSGNVATIDEKAAAERLARETPGVIDVRNAISADTALLGQVTAALAADRRTALVPIEVIADRGIVTLRGEVPSPEVRSAAEQIVRSVPGVITVINELDFCVEQPEPAPMAATWPPSR